MFLQAVRAAYGFSTARERCLGKIKAVGQVSNCALSHDEKILYLTADDKVLRVIMRK
jgi:hypothetical protein